VSTLETKTQTTGHQRKAKDTPDQACWNQVILQECNSSPENNTSEYHRNHEGESDYAGKSSCHLTQSSSSLQKNVSVIPGNREPKSFFSNQDTEANREHLLYTHARSGIMSKQAQSCIPAGTKLSFHERVFIIQTEHPLS